MIIINTCFAFCQELGYASWHVQSLHNLDCFKCVDDRKSFSLLVLFSEILDGDQYNPLQKKITLRNLNFTVPVNLLYCKEHVVQAVCAGID